MFDTFARGREVLDAVRGGPLAWRSPAEIAVALGWDLERTCDELAELHVAGWIEVWERDDGLVVTLSALAAERLGARLVENGRDDDPCWMAIGDPEPRPPRGRNVCRNEKCADFEFLMDPHPPPDLAAELSELEVASERETAGPRLPVPTLLVGIGLTPWPGPEQGRSSPCPACGSAPLTPDAYCLRCDRWGRDGTLPEPPAPGPRPNRPRSSRPRNEPRPPRLEEREARRRRERDRRKRRRKARLTARQVSK